MKLKEGKLKERHHFQRWMLRTRQSDRWLFLHHRGRYKEALEAAA
jgi:hypothetical protein